MDLTPDLVALCSRPEPELPLPEKWTPLTDDRFDVIARRLDAESGSGPLWFFAYGSLIWKPVFKPAAELRATAFGWHRSFCIEIDSWRGSVAQPGLMMALDRGGSCEGVIHRAPDDQRLDVLRAMLKREVAAEEHLYTIRWIPVRTACGPARALAFWAGPTGPGITLKLPLLRVAEIVARACGHIGSCADYLYQTVLHLEQRGIRDRNLWELQRLVADEIRSLYTPTRRTG